MTENILDTGTGTIYGGEAGKKDASTRRLVVLQSLPQYLKSKEHPERGIDYVLQGQMLEADIRDAMALAAVRLHNEAMQYSVSGFTWDLDSIEYDIPQARTVLATMVIHRG